MIRKRPFFWRRGKFQLQIKWAHLQLMWSIVFINAIKVSQRSISFAFNLGQFCTLIASRYTQVVNASSHAAITITWSHGISVK